MMTYEAYYPLLIAKLSLKDLVYSKDPQKSEEISAEVQEAMGLVLDILRDFRDRENNAYDVGWQAAANQLRGLSWDNAAFWEKALSPHPLALDDIKALGPRQWVWVEVLRPDNDLFFGESAYVKSQVDVTDGKRFCCGYPGTLYELPYDEYGHIWLAYPHQPFRKEKTLNE